MSNLTDSALQDTQAIQIAAPTEREMDAIGVALAGVLGPGDCVLLDGPMGVGKSHLARAIIRARLGDPMAEVPSPTYTLLNVYRDGASEIYHGDLYRVSSSEEIIELGIEDAATSAILLLEWPDRWSAPPLRHVRVQISMDPAGKTQGRDLTFLFKGNWETVRQSLERFA